LSRLRRLHELSWSAWLFLPGLIGFGGFIALSLRVCSLPTLVRVLESFRRVVKTRLAPLQEELTILCGLTARLWAGDNGCLLRSLLVYAVSSDASLMRGVKREGTTLLGHAWVEGAAVSREAHAYMPLTRLG